MQRSGCWTSRVPRPEQLCWSSRRAVAWQSAIDGWPAPFGQGSSSLRHSPGIVEGSAQQHLDLGIDAAELIGRPAG
jgi:hypothetical protein